MSAQCKGVLDEPGLVERMRDEKLDVMIVENIDVCRAGEPSYPLENLSKLFAFISAKREIAPFSFN